MKAMLADHTLDGGREKFLNLITFPKIVMPKYDGIRVMKVNGVLKMRSGKTVPNGYLRAALKDLPDGREGELVVNNSFSDTTSFVRSHYKEDERWHLYMFDRFDIPDKEFGDRIHRLHFERKPSLRIHCASYDIVNSLEELLQLEQQYVLDGLEGVIIRDPDAPYKFGRVTFKEQSYLSFKRAMTETARVIGYECKLEGGMSVDTLGSLQLRTSEGVEFSCGSGLDDMSRSILWSIKDELIGKSVEFKYQRSEQVKPRFPVFLRML